MLPIIPIEQLISSSNERIRTIDRQRRSNAVSTGQTEPKVEEMKLGEAKKFELAILHIDINDFKKKVRGLTEENYLRFVSIFLTEMTQIVQDANGAIELYVGDQVTALFGLEHNCSACNPEDCLRCGLNMQTVIKYSINPYFTSIGLPTITCSVGMDYGTIWLAKVGIKGSNQLTLVGHIVNVAAQLVEIAGNGQIYLGQNLYNQISQDNQGLCVQKTSSDWFWQKNNEPYRFFHYNAMWGNYSLG